YAIFLGVQRRKAEVLREFARLDECRETAVVGMRLAGDRRVVMQLLADQLAEKFVFTQILDQMLDDRALADPADTMDQDNVFEALIDFGVDRKSTRLNSSH